MDMFFKVVRVSRGISYARTRCYVIKFVQYSFLHHNVCYNEVHRRDKLVRCRCLDTISQAAVIHCDGRVIPARGFVSRPAYFYYRACIAK